MRGMEPLKYGLDVGDLIQRFEHPFDGIDTAAQFVVMANIALRSAGVELVLTVDGEVLRDERPTDAELIDQEIQRVSSEYGPISHQGARVIASQLHDGQRTAMYALASSGAVNKNQLGNEINHVFQAEGTTPQMKKWLGALYEYVEAVGDREPVPGWSGIWLNNQEQQEDESE